MELLKAITIFHALCCLEMVLGGNQDFTPSTIHRDVLGSPPHGEFHTRTGHRKAAEVVRDKLKGSDKRDPTSCHEGNVSFYRHFDEAVDNITGGIRVDKSGPGCVCSSSRGNFVLCNCSSSNLTEIPSSLSSGIHGLDLYNNSIQHLDLNAFQRFTNLKYLSLQRNNIDRLSLGCFCGLTQLLALDLRNNSLSMSKGMYPTGVFRDLPNLIALRINRNNKHLELPGLSYPDKALSDLKSLEFLSMDGLRNKTFGKGFGHLTYLQALSLSGYHDGYCKLVALTDQTFLYLAQIKFLNVSDCFLEWNSIDNKALQYLKNLHTLDFTWNEDMSIHRLGRILAELTNTDMKELFIRRVEWRFSPGATIKTEYAQNLPRNLTCIIASGNSINYLDDGVLASLPPSLRYLDFSGNKLVFGRYLEDLDKLENLEVLILNGAEFTFEIPKTYPYKELNWNCSSDISQNSPMNFHHKPTNSALKLRLPPKLLKLQMKYAGLWYVLTELNIDPNNSLEVLDLTLNYFPSIKGPFNGLNKLKKLVMSSCQITEMSKTFFENFPALEHLDLYGNLIGLGDSLLHHPFSDLSNLEYLNLGFNVILLLKNDTFLGLSELREMHIANNTLYEFNADISNMTNLELLNFETTSIHTLSLATRSHLAKLHNMTVLLSGCPLYCDCTNVEFLNWMYKDPREVIPKDSVFICVLKNRASLIVDWNEFLSEVRSLSRECASNYLLFLAVLGATNLLILLVTGSILYRFRWRLRYIYYGLHLWVTSGNAQPEENNTYHYDVFISYSNEDLNFVMAKIVPELERRGLTTHIHSRDFRVGANVITNIIRAVKVSRKTLIVLTNNFVNSKWCRAEFQMAKEESVISGRNILVFLIADTIPKNKIGRELLTHIQQNTYVPYPGEVDNREPCLLQGRSVEPPPTTPRETKMWDKLVRDIKHN